MNEQEHFSPDGEKIQHDMDFPQESMSKLDDLDESFGLEFGSYEALYEKRQSKKGEWRLIDDILKFARKYYEAGVEDGRHESLVADILNELNK